MKSRLRLKVWIVLIAAGLLILAANPALAAEIADQTARENTAWFVLSVTLIMLFSIV